MRRVGSCSIALGRRSVLTQRGGGLWERDWASSGEKCLHVARME